MTGNPAFLQPRADAIVVLGCALDGGVAGPALRRRVASGVAEFERGAAGLLVLSGGGDSSRPEAAAMREIALASGVPAERIVIEPNSRNTLENAVNTAALLRAGGGAAVILVSDRAHLKRARFLFRAAGLVVVGSAAPPGRGPWREAPAYLREAVAFPVSLLRLFWRRLTRPGRTGA